MIERHANEVTIFYNSNSHQDKKIIAYAQSNYDFVRTIDISTEAIRGTIFEEIALRLNTSIRELLKNNEDIPELGSDVDYIKFIQHNPESLKTPIVISKDKAIFANTIGEFEKVLGK
ncbi:MAG: hypothetical protein MUE81_08850 [Thermoflexibacter sp.]|jgi:arsenate reductase-like glutaredoxin family protein|nr:hypothetical protein [Thermoflexibacter sp.]